MIKIILNKETVMLITIDKRGSVNLPLAVRKELGLEPGSSLDLMVEEGGKITLHPVVIYRTMRLSASGIAKLKEARAGDTGKLPDWLRQEMDHAGTDSIE
jgi:AbrB family looped-hinge helix DNA binding protein